jgi:hypothetical protein
MQTKKPDFMCIFLVEFFNSLYRIKFHNNNWLQCIVTSRYKNLGLTNFIFYHLQQTTSNRNGNLTNGERIGFFRSAKYRWSSGQCEGAVLDFHGGKKAIMPPLGLTAGAIGRGRSSSPSTDGGRSSSPMTDGGGNSSPRTGGGGSPSYYAGVPSDSIDRAAGMGRPVGGGRSHGAMGMPGGSDGGRSGGAAAMHHQSPWHD